ncbi:MAG TPA: hypothetical protein VMY05_10045 [Acidobacteriota bacterium]|nr:hypothetical protein [Acidobacteriota bacterium]
MRSCNRMLKGIAVLVLLVFAQSMVLPQLVRAQAPECVYDKTKPSLDHARTNFKITNYDCAEMELKDLLAVDTLALQDKADAHILLAAVYYAKVRGDKEKRNRVMKEFVAAFKAAREWRGVLDIQSPEFLALMKEAQDLVDQEESAMAAVEEQVPGARVDLGLKDEDKGKKKPWYKRWWVLGIGVGVVAMAVAVAAGGGGDEPGEEPLGPLPGFPGHP